MPWKESVAMEERLRFVRDALSDRFTMSELCARYGVSRRVGYKWLARDDGEGRRGCVGDPLQHGAAGDLRRARLHHHALTQSVTHGPGYSAAIRKRV
jgi:transposase-like protein